MSGRLTTHVLDMAAGGPAVNFRIELWQLKLDREEAGAPVLLKEIRTNDDGRADAPLLQGDTLVPGVYELVFAAGEYFDARGVARMEEAFLGLVPVRFRVSNVDAHYHVPLLAAPGGYSTYRGS